MKTLLLSIVLAASCCSLPLPELDLTTRQAFKVENPMGSGSCFPLTETAYLTAWHVVENWEAPMITVDGMPVQSFLRIPEHDAVILEMGTAHGHTPWPQEARELVPGERLYVSGWGGGIHWWSEGFATTDNDRASIPVAPGDSGCPIFDAQGDVVGIVVARGIYACHHCFIEPLYELGL